MTSKNIRDIMNMVMIMLKICDGNKACSDIKKKVGNMFIFDLLYDRVNEINSKILEPKGYDCNLITKMLVEAEGVFETFEIECTLKNLDSKDFLCYMLYGSESMWSKNSNWFMMSDGLIEFQDDDVQDELFKEIGSYLKIEG